MDGEQSWSLALKGMGLWGGISGYIALHGEDDPTVYGAYFNHESETAGLGAEIKDSQAWQEKFIGKRIFDDDCKHVVLSVVKKVEDPETQVDCVTGATLTSNGVDDMIKKTFGLWTGEYDLDMDESELTMQFCEKQINVLYTVMRTPRIVAQNLNLKLGRNNYGIIQ